MDDSMMLVKTPEGRIDDVVVDEPPPLGGPERTAADILKVKCQVPKCKTMVFRTSLTKLLNLCGCHQVSRDAMFQQASKARNAQELMVELQTMEKNRPEEFLEHLANFSEECPGQGRGRKRKTWDFARIKSLNQAGTRTENFQRMKPLAKPDFVDYYVHHAPSYERLDEPAAEQLWNKQFASKDVRKDQVSARSRDGKDVGKVWRIWVPMDDGSKTASYEDRSILHERCDEQQNPSERTMQQQKETAASLFQDLEEEESIVPSISLAAPAGRGVSGPASSQGPKGTKGNSKNIVPESQHPSGRQAAATKPAVEASRQRSKTMKDFKNAELGMKKALEAGENVLQNVALKVHSGDQEAVDSDASLELLRRRLDLLRCAMDLSTGKDGDSASKDLLKRCLEDPYLKELQMNLLADAEGVQCFGKIKWIRERLLDIQPTSARVIELMDQQRTALSVLQRIIKCVEQESESWRTGAAALAKTYAEEERAKKKAEDKVQKDEEKKKVRLAKAAARDEKKKREKEEKAAAAAAADKKTTEDGDKSDEEAEEGKVSKLRRRRTGTAATDLEPSDPSVLRTLRVSQQLPSTSISDELERFVHQIAQFPTVPAVLRLKKGMTKKILSASPELNPNQINIMSKMLNADAQRFANECSEIWTKDVNKTSSGRLGSPSEGPGEALGLDKQLQCEIDNLIKIECKEDFSDAVLCRNSFADKSWAYGQSLQPPVAEAELTKDVNRIKGVTWCGSRQGSCYTGTLPFGTGALCYQYEGTRLVATVDALEMAKLKHPHVTELMENEEAGISEFIKLLEDVSADFRDLDDTDPNIFEKLGSLRVTYVIAGDILYIPYASIVCEKACGNANSISLRVMSCMMHASQQAQCLFMKRCLGGPACHVYLLSMSQLGRKVKMEMAEKGNTAMDKEGDEGNQAQPVSQNNNPIPDITGDANIIAFAQKVLQEVEEGNLDSNWDLEQVCKKVGEHSQMHTYTNYLLMDQDLQQEEWEWCAPGNDFHEDLIDFLDFVTKSGPKPASNSVNTEGGIPGDAITMTGAHNVEPEVTQSAAASVTENDPNPDAEKDKADDETNAETKDPGPISEKHSETVEPKTKTNDPNVEKKNSACDGETEVVTKTKDAEKTNSDGGDGETVEVVPDKTLELATKDPPANAEKNNGETETMAELVTSDKCKDSNTSLNTADAEAMDEDAEESEESEMFENSDPEAVTETKPKDKEKYKNTTAAASAKSKESKAEAKKAAKAAAKGKAKASAKSAAAAKKKSAAAAAAAKTVKTAKNKSAAKADAGKSRGKKPKDLPEDGAISRSPNSKKRKAAEEKVTFKPAQRQGPICEILGLKNTQG